MGALLMHRKFWLPLLIGLLVVGLTLFSSSSPARAAAVDPYVSRYLKVTEPVSLVLDNLQNTRLFSAQELSKGKALFEKNCLGCHVGGSTLPDPTVPLSLIALQGATPRRDTINALVTYLRQPMVYDGSEETFLCQQIPESWMADTDIEAIAGFVLRAAQEAPGWGIETFQN